jgi:hypothetical protein
MRQVAVFGKLSASPFKKCIISGTVFVLTTLQMKNAIVFMTDLMTKSRKEPEWKIEVFSRDDSSISANGLAQ